MNWVVDDGVRMIALQCIDNYLKHVGTANHSNLDYGRLNIIDDSVELSAYHLGRQVVEVLNTQSVLYGYGRNYRQCLCAK